MHRSLIPNRACAMRDYATIARCLAADHAGDTHEAARHTHEAALRDARADRLTRAEGATA